MATDYVDDEREQELDSISSIWPELVRGKDPYQFSLDLPVIPRDPIKIHFVASAENEVKQDDDSIALLPSLAPAMDSFIHLPPLQLLVTLPAGYPETLPPHVSISSVLNWIPDELRLELESGLADLWEDYQSQVLFAFIDSVQEKINNGFDTLGSLQVPGNLRIDILDFQASAMKHQFDSQTFACEVCQEPQKGAVCHKMSLCGHVFCKSCITDCYTTYIEEGSVDRVTCMAFKCEILTNSGKLSKPTIAPAELLQVPLPKALVQRYAELKRKKKIELDKSIVYCPRPWCQQPARSEKYPQLQDLSLMTEVEDMTTVPTSTTIFQDDSVISTAIENGTDDRLRQCEKCSFAFCRVCKHSWHGEYFRCRARDAAELSKEEQATLAFIRRNTSECPVCLVPTQKSMGCNHMTCGQCRTHFCYLCAQWLDPSNPYNHFNIEGRPCYQRLWDLEGGDDGHGVFFGARAAELQAEMFHHEIIH